MRHNVLTLVGTEDSCVAAVESATAELRRHAERVDPPRWLAARSACDLFFDGADPEIAETRVRAALAGAAVDLAAQPLLGRRKRLLVADMESTVIRNEMLDELAEFAGVRSRVEEITARAMAGELDFPGSLRRRAALLAAQPATIIDRALERVEVDPGARQLVATLSSHGAFTALVSGGFGVFVAPLARRLGFDAWRANELHIEDGRITGGVGEPILGRGAKVRALEEFCCQLAITPAEAAAVGDGANDLAMLDAVGLGVAFHAKPAVAAAARYRVTHGDLRTLLYFQGYGAAEFVGD